MCELFGISSKQELYLNDLLKEFFSHGVDHPNGWGMAFFEGNFVSIEKEPEASFKSKYLKRRLKDEIRESHMVAHIRLATRGTMEYNNSHPFTKRDKENRTWTLIHNGTIFNCDALNKYTKIQKGHTDSERILLYIIDKINESIEAKGHLDKEERFNIIDTIINEITPGNKVNIIIYDSELLYAHTNYKGSLHINHRSSASIISTRPLDQEDWEELPLNTLLAYEDGIEVLRGRNHHHEFFETEENMKLLFVDYANL